MRSSDRARRASVRSVVALAVAALLALAGCTGSPDPTPSTPGATPRPFTVMSTDQVRVTDPAAVTDAASAMFTLNVFQRLMSAPPGYTGLSPKPDAARDCVVTAPTTYTCTLNQGLSFANGHALTSSDVKFSIERALRLAVPGSSTSLLSSLRQIETPDDVTVRFLLSRVDTQFIWALASPAASIVDEQTYDADKVRPTDQPAVGSGPFTVTEFAADQISFAHFPAYKGFDPPAIDNLVYRSVPDSATIEDAMSKGLVDVVWRGLNDAAVIRLNQQVQLDPDKRTQSGFTVQTLTGTRVLMLQWATTSVARQDKGLRQAISAALQGDRTLDSVVPGGISGHVSVFALGGKVTPKVTWKNRINLVLGYDSTAPNAQDIATQIRTRLEDTGGLSVRLRPDSTDVDLSLVDRKAWTPTALAWLQPYLDHPLDTSAASVEATQTAYEASYEQATTNRLIAVLQRQAAADALVLPISQSDELVWTRTGSAVSPASFGPGWQLGFFGMTHE